MSGGEGIVIVGGGPAGLSAARSYREAGGEERVRLLCAERHRPYERPPLTKEFLRGEGSVGDLPLEDPGWYKENEVEVSLGSAVVALDRGLRRVRLSGGEEIGYSRCVLSPGARPALPPVPGADGPGVRVIRRIEDAERVREDFAEGRRRFVVIGSGFIGCEAAASLAMLGGEVVMVTMEEAPQLERLGGDVSREISLWLSGLGIELHAGAEVREIRSSGEERSGDGCEVAVRDGSGREGVIGGDAVVLGAGMLPNVGLAESAGLSVDGGVVCDASMRTSDGRIFAAGDVAFAMNAAAGRRLRVEHWGDALGQGRVCGERLAGREAVWEAVPGFWSTIGERTIKYSAWGDGWDEARFDGASDGFTVWYGLEGRCVGVLTHGRDEDYGRGGELVGAGARLAG
ncbi:NAD(P)/FAD-dependent oxidoreductase [Rubrobacter indicoceani]|uniref:NAD(P)/FAD-dependent oxidoreductase n=1 Tax=Rubrobacter indicoceani TaxID=2051957 RepID=UPI0013C4CC83|nr:FAD-dependent oxidoreductase [Rubrobacter indicoceani]